MHPLAELVVEHALADAEGAKRAAEVADSRNLPLVAVLVRDFGVDEMALVVALRKSSRVPLTDPAKVQVDTEALRQISRDDCRRLRALPIELGVYDAGPSVLRVAMADPTDAVAIAELEHLSGCRLEPTLMPLSAVEELVEKAYGQFVTEVMQRKQASAPGDSRQPSRHADVKPTTTPFRRVVDDAAPALRIEALVKLLIERGVIREEDYEEALRAVMKARS